MQPDIFSSFLNTSESLLMLTLANLNGIIFFLVKEIISFFAVFFQELSSGTPTIVWW